LTKSEKRHRIFLLKESTRLAGRARRGRGCLVKNNNLGASREAVKDFLAFFAHNPLKSPNPEK
jgi:hypothetical protein